MSSLSERPIDVAQNVCPAVVTGQAWANRIEHSDCSLGSTGCTTRAVSNNHDRLHDEIAKPAEPPTQLSTPRSKGL